MVLLFRTVAGYHRVFHHVSGPEFSLLNLVLNLAATRVQLYRSDCAKFSTSLATTSTAVLGTAVARHMY